MVQTNRNFVMFLVLSIVTCGIYGIYFFYVLANDVNTICEGDGETTTSYVVAFLLSIITCGIYMWFWYYKLGNRLYNNAARYNTQIDESGTTVLLWMILGSFLAGIGIFIGQYFIINNTNKLAERYVN